MAYLEYSGFPGTLTPADWERAFAPYDEDTYQPALNWLTAADVVLDIGAGDLRFARRAAARVRALLAIEQHAELISDPLPRNLRVQVGDARAVPFPTGLTTGVLLMRHCQHFKLYLLKLRAAGARWLITNARWGMGVERLDLAAPRVAYAKARAGWYACDCGATGFITHAPADITTESLNHVMEVAACPHCRFGKLTFCGLESTKGHEEKI